uniref:Uncharacterized protein n=1 Tax=Oncorhynchus tshawytscha TaxID=74940 RepID=A0A8C8J092_ONCTS
MEQTVTRVYVTQKEGADGLGNIAMACALLFGLIYCLNLSYPQELKCTFEVLQNILLNLDGQRVLSKKCTHFARLFVLCFLEATTLMIWK